MCNFNPRVNIYFTNFCLLVVRSKAETTKAKSSGVYFASQLQQHYDDVVTGSKADKRRKARYTEALRLQVKLGVFASVCRIYLFRTGEQRPCVHRLKEP